MELRHYRYFVAVAEELHFGRAAERLAVSQPPVSFAIKQMEEELGTDLFERVNKRVYLTPAGRILLDRARDILARSDEAQDFVRRTAAGIIGEVRIAYTPSALLIRGIADILHSFRQEHPQYVVNLIEMSSDHQSEALIQRRIDLGLLRPGRAINAERIDTRVIDKGELSLVLHAMNPLADKEIIRPDELREQGFVCPPQDSGTLLRQKTLDICSSAGFAPRIVQEVSDLTAIVSVIATNIGVAFVPEAMRALKLPGIHYAAIDHPGRFCEMAIANLRGDISDPARTLRGFLLDNLRGPKPSV